MDIEFPQNVDRAAVEKFVSKVTTPMSRDGCWIWGDAIPKKGYPDMRYNNKTCGAHQLAYDWWRGNRPSRMSQTCKTAGCVNPWHFEPGYNRSTVWNKKDISKELLHELYIKKRMNSNQIAEELGTVGSVIIRKLHDCGIPVRSLSEAMMGRRPGNYRGWMMHKAGYKYIILEKDDPCLPMAGQGRKVFEHRLVMARHLGRCLESWEIVHHKDHDRLNNTIENLELIQRSTIHHGETFTHEALLVLKAENEQLRQYIAELEEALGRE